MLYVKVKIYKTGEVVDARSYGYGWVTCDGRFIHRSYGKVILQGA